MLLCRDVGRAVAAGQATAAEASAAGRRPQRQDLPQAWTHRAGAQEHPVGRLPRSLTARYLSVPPSLRPFVRPSVRPNLNCQPKFTQKHSHNCKKTTILSILNFCFSLSYFKVICRQCSHIPRITFFFSVVSFSLIIK